MKNKKTILTLAILSALGGSQAAIASVSSSMTLNGITRTVEFATQEQLEGMLEGTAPFAERVAFAQLFTDPVTGVTPTSTRGLVSTSTVDGVPVSLVAIGDGQVAMAVVQPQVQTDGTTKSEFVTVNKSGDLSAASIAAEYVKSVSDPSYVPADPALATALTTSVKAGIDDNKEATANELLAKVGVNKAPPVDLPSGAITADSIVTVTDPKRLLQIEVAQDIAKASLNQASEAAAAVAVTPSQLANSTPVAVTPGAVSSIAANPIVQLQVAKNVQEKTETVAVARIAEAAAVLTSTTATPAQKATALETQAAGTQLQTTTSVTLVAKLTDPALPAAAKPSLVELEAASAKVTQVTQQLQATTTALQNSPFLSSEQKASAAVEASTATATAVSAQSTVSTAIINNPTATPEQIAAVSAQVASVSSELTKATETLKNSGASAEQIISATVTASTVTATALNTQAAASSAIVNNVNATPEQIAAVSTQVAEASKQLTATTAALVASGADATTIATATAAAATSTAEAVAAQTAASSAIVSNANATPEQIAAASNQVAAVSAQLSAVTTTLLESGSATPEQIAAANSAAAQAAAEAAAAQAAAATSIANNPNATPEQIAAVSAQVAAASAEVAATTAALVESGTATAEQIAAAQKAADDAAAAAVAAQQAAATAIANNVNSTPEQKAVAQAQQSVVVNQQALLAKTQALSTAQTAYDAAIAANSTATAQQKQDALNTLKQAAVDDKTAKEAVVTAQSSLLTSLNATGSGATVEQKTAAAEQLASAQTNVAAAQVSIVSLDETQKSQALTTAQASYNATIAPNSTATTQQKTDALNAFKQAAQDDKAAKALVATAQTDFIATLNAANSTATPVAKQNATAQLIATQTDIAVIQVSVVKTDAVLTAQTLAAAQAAYDTAADKSAALQAIKVAAQADKAAKDVIVTAQTAVVSSISQTGSGATEQEKAAAATQLATEQATVVTASAQITVVTAQQDAIPVAQTLATVQSTFNATFANPTAKDEEKQAAWTALKTAATNNANAKLAVANAQQQLVDSLKAANSPATQTEKNSAETKLAALKAESTTASTAALPDNLAKAYNDANPGNKITLKADASLQLFDFAPVLTAVSAERSKVVAGLGAAAAAGVIAAEQAIINASANSDSSNIATLAQNLANQLAQVKTSQFQVEHNGTSGIAGNPASTMNMTIDNAFNQIADFNGSSEASTTNLASASSDSDGINSSIGIGLQYGYYNINGRSVNTVTMPLTYTAKFNPKHQLTVSVPLSYIQTQGQADAYQVGAGLAYKYHVTDNWLLIPAVSYSYRSFDTAQNEYLDTRNNTALAGGSITSKYTWNFNQMGVSLINMIGHFQSLDSNNPATKTVNFGAASNLGNNGFVTGTAANQTISNYVIKNGLHLTKVFGNFKVGTYFTDTEYFGSALYFNQMNEFGFSLKPVNAGRMLDALSIDANYLFSIGGKHSSELDGFRLNLGYKF